MQDDSKAYCSGHGSKVLKIIELSKMDEKIKPKITFSVQCASNDKFDKQKLDFPKVDFAEWDRYDYENVPKDCLKYQKSENFLFRHATNTLYNNAVKNQKNNQAKVEVKLVKADLVQEVG